MITIAEKLVFAKAHWNLRNIEIIYENADKAVYSAVSSKFGDVILKVNQNTKDILYQILYKQELLLVH